MLGKAIISMVKWLYAARESDHDRFIEVQAQLRNERASQHTRTMTEQQREQSDRLISQLIRESVRLGWRIGNAEAIARAY